MSKKLVVTLEIIPELELINLENVENVFYGKSVEYFHLIGGR